MSDPLEGIEVGA